MTHAIPASKIHFGFEPQVGEVGIAAPTETKMTVQVDDVQVDVRVSAADGQALAETEAALKGYLYEAGRTAEGRAELIELFSGTTDQVRTKGQLEAELKEVQDALRMGHPSGQAIKLVLKATLLLFTLLTAKSVAGESGVTAMAATMSALSGAALHLLASALEAKHDPVKGPGRKVAAFLGYTTLVRNVMLLLQRNSTAPRAEADLSRLKRHIAEVSAMIEQSGASALDDLLEKAAARPAG